MPSAAFRRGWRREVSTLVNVLLVAPFERGAAFGGSQRATALVERLERRGASVDWLTVEPAAMSVSRRLKAVLTLEPGFVAYRSRRVAVKKAAWDVAVAAHSYMAPHLSRVEPRAARVVDFHNLEWRHILDVSAYAPPLKRAHLRLESKLMRRFERGLLGSGALCLFTSQAELEWAEATGACRRALAVPNTLPREAACEAERIWAARAIRRGRSPRPASRTLVYIGKLSYPPNLLSLQRFLDAVWPRILAADRSARLSVIGECAERDRRRIAGCPGVEAHGLVEDPTDALVEADAALLPLSASAGTSLRILLYALAGVPVVGSPSAFRGVPDEMGLAAKSATEWVELLSEEGRLERCVQPARAAALAIQSADAPWQELYDWLERGTRGERFR